MTSSQLPPPHRPLPVRLINTLGRGLEALGIQLLKIDDTKLLKAAQKKTGLSDFGADEFRSGLRVLTQAIESEGQPTLMGRVIYQRQLLDLLTYRLQLIDHWKKYPEIAEEKIKRPLFIIGLPRTGTTLLHSLLDQDPALRAPLTWETAMPFPAPEAATFTTDPRIAQTDRNLDIFRWLAPGFETTHPMGALLPQECISFTAYDFHSIQFEVSFNAPSYQRWYCEHDPSGVYAFHHQFLRHLQHHVPGEQWVLKTPAHLNSMDTLFAEYPDALIVQTHRDPLAVTPSICSLIYTMRCAGSNHLDPIEIGRQQSLQWSSYLNAGMHVRDSLPEKSNQFFDIYFEEIIEDSIDCVRRIYEHFDMDFSQEAQNRMTTFLAENQRHKHGVHKYTLEMFGFDEDELTELYAEYCQRFNIKRQPKA